jgi:3-oxoacyl-(acyl-carrier-protein) synthase
VMPGQRVVVTGLGQVSSLGTDVASFSERVFAGRPGVQRLQGLGAPGLEDPIGASVLGFDPRAWLPARVVPTTSRVAQYACAAATQAFAASGLGPSERSRGGVFVGSGFGPIAEIEETYRTCFTTPGVRPRPTVIPTAMANASAALLAAQFRLRGPNLTLTVACAAATHAIGQAFRLLRAGDADVMLAGGAEAPLTAIVLAAWNAMRVLAPAGDDPARACRPFSRDRQGLVIGEGAAFLLLETLAHAEGRGARVLAEVLGYAANADAGHITHPDAEGVRSCMAAALSDAQLEPEAVGYINAHGTGTSVNDRLEAEAIASLFGAHAPRLPVSSTKAVHGHAMGASGALEAVATVLALGQGRVPPTANLAEVDPDLPALDYVTTTRSAAVEVALSNSFAFGGNNAVLVLGRAS